MKHPIPDNEEARLENLVTYGILDTESEQEYDDITALTAYICNTSIATIAFIDKDRKWHKSKFGIKKEFVPRSISICAHTIMDTQSLVINDTLKDDVFCEIGMVVNPPHIRFYAGVPLISSEGYALGTLCALDTEPKELDEKQYEALQVLGRSVVSLLEARRNVMLLEANQVEISKLNKELATLSRTDELTGLWNRRVLHEALSRELKLNKRSNNSLSVMMIDIDKFKSINDDFGHKFGDDVISKIASILKEEVRETDYCVRYGGDEFIIIAPDTNKELSTALSSRIRTQIEAASKTHKTFSVSIGVAVIESEVAENDEVLQLVDKCLYKAKECGRNCVEIQTL